MDQGTLDVVNGVKVGTASVNWGFDPLYTWVRTPSFTRMLDEMVQAGYAGTEISYNFPENPDEIRRELSTRQLDPAATFHAVNLRTKANHEPALHSSMRVADRLQRLGSDVLILSDEVSAERLQVAGRAQPQDALSQHGWQNLADGLNRIAERLADRGMKTVFHPHVGTYVETRDEIDRLCELTDASILGLCPDTGHLAYAGAAPEEVFRDYRTRIRYVHLKDVDGMKLAHVRRERINFAQGVELGMFVELGKGVVPIGAIVQTLRSADYNGWIIVEQDAPAQPLASATENRRYLREQFGL